MWFYVLYAIPVVLLLLVILCRRPSYAEERRAAEMFVKERYETNADESLLGRMGNSGVSRSIRWVSMMNDRSAVVFLCISQFFRGGYPEGQSVRLITVAIEDQKVLNSVSIQTATAPEVFVAD